jgi:hypothetical protein
MTKRIYEINLQIYPRKIWVVDLRGVECIECFIKTLKFKTKRIDGSFKLIHDGYKSDYFDNVRASVIEAISSKNDIGIIVFLLNPCDVSSIVHESVHIADYVFESLGMIAQDYSGRNEQYAYLVEYVFKEINKL